MAGHDPRRSSRARGTQPQSQHSSTTSSTSGRDRTTRGYNKNASPQKSTPTGSLSSASPENTMTIEEYSAHRRTRGHGDDRDKVSSTLGSTDNTNGDDEIQEEDEAVRCICGFDEYPGPPPLEEDSKHGVKESVDIDPIFTTDVNDEMAGFFVQCDVCKVWQHGACVGIMTEESSPDEYFCEQCRKEFHKIFTASNGQRYSHYLPLKRQQSRATSRADSIIKDGTKSPKGKEGRNGRKSSDSQTGKRRSTMNSRGGAYDEAEALRRAIEASKEDAGAESAVVDEPPRRGKRGRSDSEEKPENAKRRRTDSDSPSPPPADKEGADDSDEGLSNMRNGTRTKSRAAAATSRSTRSEKPADKDEKERQRLEAANKRRDRAGRRRVEGTTRTDDTNETQAHVVTESDPAEEVPLAAAQATATKPEADATPAVAEPVANPTPPEEKEKPVPPVVETPAATPSEQPSPDAPSLPDPAPPSLPAAARMDRRRSHKKKGRNQYTRDRDDDSPARSLSRDISKDDTGNSNHTNTTGSRGEGHHGGRHSKAKGGMNSRVTMTDMKRRAAAILEYISRTQLELAGEAVPSTVNGGGTNADATKPAETSPNGVKKEFTELSSMEMMDTLTRKLVKWQQEFTT